MFPGAPRPLTKIYLPRESSPGEEWARIMTGTPGSSASDRERKCERVKGWRLGDEAGGSGVSDKVIMTFLERSGLPVSSGAGDPEELDLLEASDSTESMGLGGSMMPSGRVRDASMVTQAVFCSFSLSVKRSLRLAQPGRIAGEERRKKFSLKQIRADPKAVIVKSQSTGRGPTQRGRNPFPPEISQFRSVPSPASREFSVQRRRGGGRCEGERKGEAEEVVKSERDWQRKAEEKKPTPTPCKPPNCLNSPNLRL
jgi:hypothetical protein